MSEDTEVTGTVDDAIRNLLENDDEAAREYLKESFLTRAMLALFNARRDAGLTQAQVAERLGTKQSSIARLERDLSGSVTLRRFVEVALACGMMPFDVALAPVEDIRRAAIERPDEPRLEPPHDVRIDANVEIHDNEAVGDATGGQQATLPNARNRRR